MTVSKEWLEDSKRVDRELEAARKRKEVALGFIPAIDIHQYEISKCHSELSFLSENEVDDPTRIEALKDRIKAHEESIEHLRHRLEEWNGPED